MGLGRIFHKGRGAVYGEGAGKSAYELTFIVVGFEVFTAVTMKNAVFWGVAPCRCGRLNRRFGGSYPSIFRVEKFASEEPA
jgi:hypothetical protein